MTGFFAKIKSLVQGKDQWRTAPFASVGTARKWLQSLPGSSDYDAHHMLVEGLERYNGDTRGDALNRIKVLQAVEEAGLPLQARMVRQYLQGYTAGESARQALWRECHLFWDQLAVAYQTFLNLVQRDGRNGKFSSLRTEIIVKSLRYFSLSMRWGYLRGRRPGESAWRRLHKIYRMAEMADVVFGEVEIEGRKTTCVREYVMSLLFELANPYAFGAEEIPLVLEILDGLEDLPVPDHSLRRDRHTHMVDLSAFSGPEKIEDRWVPGGRLRYLDLHGVLHELEQRSNQNTLQGMLCGKLVKAVGRVGTSRRGPRSPIFGEVKAVFGMDSVLKVFAPYRGATLNAEFLTLRDESLKGVGFVLDEEPDFPPGCLLAIERDEGHKAWQLLAARWIATEKKQWQLGAEYLSKFPRRVDIEWGIDGTGRETTMALFLPLASVSQGVTSNLLLPQSAYSSGREILLRQDDGTSYRLKLGAIIETHESWLRVAFDVLSREAT